MKGAASKPGAIQIYTHRNVAKLAKVVDAKLPAIFTPKDLRT